MLLFFLEERVQDWIYGYELPTFPKYVAGQMDMVEYLNPRIRKEIISCLFRSMVCYTR